MSQDEAELGICQRAEHRTDRPKLWDPRAQGETPAQRDYRHRQARLLCRQCPMLRACEEYLSQLERDSISIVGVVAGRYPDYYRTGVSNIEEVQTCCRICQKPMIRQGKRATKRKRQHKGEGLCSKCWPHMHSRGARR